MIGRLIRDNSQRIYQEARFHIRASAEWLVHSLGEYKLEMFFKIIQREILRNSSLRWCAPLVRAHIINTKTSIQNGTTAAQISDWMCLQRATCFITKNVVYCLVKRKICSVVRKTRYKYSSTKSIDISNHLNLLRTLNDKLEKSIKFDVP